MNREAHWLIAVGAGAVTAHTLGITAFSDVLPMPLSLSFPMLVSAAGALVPDLDQRWAPQHYAPRPGSCCKWNEHRGATHSLSLAIMFGVAIGFGITPWIGIMFTVGWLSHLAADAVSPLGLPFLWPLSARRYRLLPYALRIHFRSGKSPLEIPLALCVLLLCLYASGFFHGQLAGF